MSQFFVDPKDIQGNFALIKGPDAKHLIKVLRYKIGDTLHITNGHSRFRAVIETIHTKEVSLRLIEEEITHKKSPAPSLGIPLLKHDHLEWVLEKGVELGCHHFFLFISERTIPHYQKWDTKKLERFQKIAKAAGKQSGLISPVTIHPPKPWKDWLKNLNQFSGTLLAWEEEKLCSFRTAFQSIDPSKLLLITGPEGGFTPHEVAEAEKEGAKLITLGSQILRSETASLLLLTLSQYELGNL